MNENNFTSRVRWALIEEIAPHAEEMAGEKEMACCVRGYHVYKDIWAAAIREVLVCSTEPTNVGKYFVVKLYLRKIFSYVFCVRKYFYNENKVNYSIVINQAQMLYFVCLLFLLFCFEIVCTVHCERDVTYYSFAVTIN